MLEEHIQSYGILESKVTQNEIDRHVEEIEYLGYTVVNLAMNVSELPRVADAIDRYYRQQITESANSSTFMETDVDILRCPLTYDDVFLEIATLKSLMEICQRILGLNFVLLQ